MIARGIDLALSGNGASLLSSHARSCEIGMRRPHVTMKTLKQMLLAMAMLCILSASAFAFDPLDQRDDQQKPPKPDRPVVVVKPKPKPPPDNREQEKQRDNKRGKPSSFFEMSD